eukprot:Phypoly_transcript_02521.p1 GENE.Phypoly_transcript_02521~~Phypoly_transcript_02521.p1  ORF type:complete len:358 (+),score=92.25 Phypoly_transcript_02521:1387-2460(+)
MNDPNCLMGVIRMRRKRFNGEMQRRAIGERKHTTDTERQSLLDYYDKFGTCTTVPEFVELQQRLGWDAHRTKIWLYNRKTYHHHRPGDKRKKPRTSSPTPDGTSNYDGDTDEEMFYGEENEMGNNEEGDRDKGEMIDEEHQHEYIAELEQLVSSLKQQLETEISNKKAEAKKGQANAERITELEQALARSEARQEPNEASSEIALLRTQVDLYFNDLREEKKKRAQEEIKALDYLAQINALNLRITTLEKALQSAGNGHSPNVEPPKSGADAQTNTEAQKSDEPMVDAHKADAREEKAQKPEAHREETQKLDAQGRKVFPGERTRSPPRASEPASPLGKEIPPAPAQVLAQPIPIAQ